MEEELLAQMHPADAAHFREMEQNPTHAELVHADNEQEELVALNRDSSKPRFQFDDEIKSRANRLKKDLGTLTGYARKSNRTWYAGMLLDTLAEIKKDVAKINKGTNLPPEKQGKFIKAFVDKLAELPKLISDVMDKNYAEMSEPKADGSENAMIMTLARISSVHSGIKNYMWKEKNDERFAFVSKERILKMPVIEALLVGIVFGLCAYGSGVKSDNLKKESDKLAQSGAAENVVQELKSSSSNWANAGFWLGMLGLSCLGTSIFSRKSYHFGGTRILDEFHFVNDELAKRNTSFGNLVR